MPTEETRHPGAGTLFVYSQPAVRGMSPARSSKRGASPFAGAAAVPTRWEEVITAKEKPVTVATPDSLLKHGIAEYTYLSHANGGVLGRGKFSTVYKVLGADGDYHALKHTPLYPHHPLISARLLREPTLLAELPSHPCLIGVEGWVRTEGHFYLVEQYATSHVPLPLHPLPLPPSRAAYILDQLVSCVRDTLHEKGRVCHRDLKGDNVLVDVDTGEIVILDLGLATRFSASEPKLTTCCGSPAFHSPEIVQALARPPGEITYYGPELDIWCIALTLLSLLLQVRFPLGPKHTSPYVMRERVMDRLQELDELYPPHAPWRVRSSSRGSRSDSGSISSNVDTDHEKREWRRVRKAMADFLEIDGVRRMEKFRAYEIGEQTRTRVRAWEEGEAEKKFKSTTFVPAEVKYTLPIYLEDPGMKAASGDLLTLRNPMGESERRVTSYLKYLLRSSGILYHVLPSPPPPPVTAPLTPPPSTTPPSSVILQVVVPLADAPAAQPNPAPPVGWFPSLFSFTRKPTTPPGTPTPRSVSVPPSKGKSHSPSPVPMSANASANKMPRVLGCYVKLEFEQPAAQPSPPLDRKRRASAETFTSFRDGLGLAPLQIITTSTTSSTSTSQTATPTATTPAISPHPGRSSSVSRPAAAPRPHPRRAASLAPSGPSSPRPSAIRLPSHPYPAHAAVHAAHAAVTTNGTVPLSPLSQQVSLASSDASPPPSRAPSRAPSRGSSRSRPSGHGGHGLLLHHLANGHGANGVHPHSESKILVHLSDPRAYPALRRALDIKPEQGVGMHHSSGDPSLSPMTIRRGSLAPSIVEAVGMEGYEDREKEEEEPERGRARSKEDSSSMLSNLSKGSKGKVKLPMPLSPTPTMSKLPLASADVAHAAYGPVDVHVKHVDREEFENGEKLGNGGGRPRDDSRGRPKGLLDVLFGRGGDVRTPRSASMPPPMAYGDIIEQSL